MSEPCLCGDPACPRCFANPEAMSEHDAPRCEKCDDTGIVRTGSYGTNCSLCATPAPDAIREAAEEGMEPFDDWFNSDCPHTDSQVVLKCQCFRCASARRDAELHALAVKVAKIIAKSPCVHCSNGWTVFFDGTWKHHDLARVDPGVSDLKCIWREALHAAGLPTGEDS